jgi:Ca2+-binding RTX toxin-like protein
VKDDTQKKFDLTYGYALGLTARGADALEVLDVADSGDVVGKDILFLSELNLLSGTPPLVLGLDTTIKSATVLRSAFFESGFFAMSSYASSGLQRGRALAVQGDLLVASIAIDVANLPTGASDLLTGVSGIVQIFRKASATDYKQEALLFDKSVSSDDNFGDSLALWSGGDYDYLAVGAPRLDTAAGLGRVYVYRYEGERGWFLYDTVLAATSTVRGFGTDVTFTSDGDLVVSSSDGNIYVYDFVSLAPKVSGGGLGDGTGDRLFGGDGDDILRSGTGADVLDGGSGTDEVFYADYSANYSFVSRGHVLEVTINGVTDRLYNIERIKFLDKTFELEKGTASGSVVETVGLKLKLPAVTDVTLPVASSKSASVTKDSVMVKVTPSEGGRMYVLVREEDGGLPSVMDVVIDGEEVLVVGGTMKTLTVDGLSSGTDYVPYVVLEDGSGNFSGVIAVETEVTTGASVLSNLGSTKFGSYRHEVSFELDGDGFVYYAYKLSGSKPGAAEMRSGPSGSSLSGVTWVADGGVSHKIYLPSLGAGKVYVMSDGEGVVHEVEVSSSWVDDEMWGLSFGSDFLG